MNIRIVEHGEEDPSALMPHPENWREHPATQKAMLDGIIEDVGYVQSVLVNKRTGHIVDGHMRVAMAVEQGWDTIPVEYVDLNENEEKIVLATINPVAGLAEKNKERISAIADAIETKNSRVKGLISSLATSSSEGRTQILEEAQEERDEAVQEFLEEYPVSPGEMWKVGNHQFWCMDSTEPETWATIKVLEPEIGMCITSPPYFMNKDYEEETTEEEVVSHIYAVASGITEVMNPSRRININVGLTPFTHINGHRDTRLNLDWWMAAFRDLEWSCRYVRCWEKTGHVYSNPQTDLCDMHWEMIGTFYCPTAPHRGANRVNEGWASEGIWDDIPKPHQTHHSAPFAPELPIRYILIYTDVDEIVLDPYGGSGTTAFAANKSGRHSLSIEKDPASVSYSISRLATATNATPELMDVKKS